MARKSEEHRHNFSRKLDNFSEKVITFIKEILPKVDKYYSLEAYRFKSEFTNLGLDNLHRIQYKEEHKIKFEKFLEMIHKDYKSSNLPLSEEKIDQEMTQDYKGFDSQKVDLYLRYQIDRLETSISGANDQVLSDQNMTDLKTRIAGESHILSQQKTTLNERLLKLQEDNLADFAVNSVSYGKSGQYDTPYSKTRVLGDRQMDPINDTNQQQELYRELFEEQTLKEHLNTQGKDSTSRLLDQNTNREDEEDMGLLSNLIDVNNDHNEMKINYNINFLKMKKLNHIDIEKNSTITQLLALNNRKMIVGCSSGKVFVVNKKDSYRTCWEIANLDSQITVLTILQNRYLIIASDSTYKALSMVDLSQSAEPIIEYNSSDTKILALTKLEPSYFVTGDNQGFIKFWEYMRKTPLQNHKLHIGQINSVALIKNDKMMLTAGNDCNITICEICKNMDILVVGRLKDFSPVLEVRPLLNGKNHCFSLSQDGTLKMWNFEQKK